MAQFDVYRWQGRLLLDCQSEALSGLDTRIAAPLVSTDGVRAFPRLTPSIQFEGERYFIAVQLMAAVPVRALGQPIGSLAEHRYEILGAIDLLVTGY